MSSFTPSPQICLARHALAPTASLLAAMAAGAGDLIGWVHRRLVAAKTAWRQRSLGRMASLSLSCVSLVAVDLLAGGAGPDGDGLAVNVEPETVVIRGPVTTLRAWIIPTWIRWVATMIEPRCDTRRCTTTGPASGEGPGAARRAPRSRWRLRGGTGHGRVR